MRCIRSFSRQSTALRSPARQFAGTSKNCMWKLYGMVGHTMQFVEAVKDTGETKRKEIGKVTEERAYRFLWQKTEDGNARLLRAFCEVPDLVLPERIDGCLLTEIGDYCFAEAEHLPGEGVRVFSAGVDEKETEGRLAPFSGNYPEVIRLPESVKKIGSLAFYNCGNLKELTVGKNLCGIGSDAFMNCRKLKALIVMADVREKTGLKQILAQISWDITVSFLCGGNIRAKIFYPEYQEFYDEIAPAHIFGRNIEGEGFRARQAFSEGVVQPAQYDKIFPRACVEENEDTLVQLAAARLLYPVDLKGTEQNLYEAYVREHSFSLAKRLIRERDLEQLKFLCERKFLAGGVLNEAAAFAAETAWTEGAASLLTWKKEFDVERTKERYTFDGFDDF